MMKALFRSSPWRFEQTRHKGAQRRLERNGFQISTKRQEKKNLYREESGCLHVFEQKETLSTLSKREKK